MLADVLEHCVHAGALRIVCAHGVLVRPMPGSAALLAVRAMQGIGRARHEARLVRPAFEDLAAFEGLAEPVGRIGAEARKKHEIGTACDHVDGVDLQQLHAFDGRQQALATGSRCRLAEQALGFEVQIARLLQAEVHGHSFGSVRCR